MKAVILAGGLGTRLSEETSVRPKPMVEIGGKPIIWHIMKTYSQHNINDFIICCGYKGYQIKEYFTNYLLHTSDISIDIASNTTHILQKRTEPWTVTLVDTGDHSMTGGRLLRVAEYVKDSRRFCMTYGDGVSNIDISALVQFHDAHGKLATVTAVHPAGRFGAMEINCDKVVDFKEKPRGDGAMINGGFFVLSPGIFEYLNDDSTVWEESPLQRLSAEGQLMAYRHNGYWQPMDTLRDKLQMEQLWISGKAPWKTWSN